MLYRARVLVAMCAAVLGTDANAFANPVSYAYAFDAANYLIAPSGNVNVNVYLQEIVGPGETSVLSRTGVGLFGAGVKVRFDAAVLMALDITANSAFDDVPTTTVVDGSAMLAENTASITDFVHGYQPDPSKTEYRLLVGTFAFKAGATPGETTPIFATPYGNAGSVVITGDEVALDSLIAEATTGITVIPEPSAMALASIAALAILAFSWWSSKWLLHRLIKVRS